jgi:hypothetical protein
MASVQAKIAATFEKDSPEYKYVDVYLSELRTNWRETEKAIAHSSMLIVALSVLFELVLDNKAGAPTFLGIKLTSTQVVEFSLIPIVAYLYYSITYSFTESQIFFDVHGAIMEKVYPALFGADGEVQLSPANSLIGSADRVSYAMGDGSANSTLAAITGGIRPIAILLAPPFFVIIAYIQLFTRHGPINSLLWGSLAIGGILVAAAAANVYLLIHQVRA